MMALFRYTVCPPAILICRMIWSGKVGLDLVRGKQYITSVRSVMTALFRYTVCPPAILICRMIWSGKVGLDLVHGKQYIISVTAN